MHRMVSVIAACATVSARAVLAAVVVVCNSGIGVAAASQVVV
jgi:hypothetical protein